MNVGTPGRCRLVPWALAGVLAACARHAPEPTVSAVPAANPAAPVVAPHRASGVYVLTTDLKLSRPAAPPRRGRRQPPAPVASLRLDFQPLATPDATAASNTQLAATINLPGYTRAPPGRTGEAAVWWPLPGDTVVVHFATPRGDGQMDLRGMLQGDTLSGEIWYTSSTTGNVFQMGTFRAVKQKK